jgi:UPF0716 protein FxsA
VALLVLLFIVVPIAELVVIIQVGQSMGVLTTVLLLIVVSVVGAWMVKFQGIVLLARARSKMARGEMPDDELIAGIAVLFAGALMLTPGFITDAVGLALLISPIRAVLIGFVRRRFRGRVQNVTDMPFDDNFLDGDGWEAE